MRGDFSLSQDDTGDVYISSWNTDLPRPTTEQLNSTWRTLVVEDKNTEYAAISIKQVEDLYTEIPKGQKEKAIWIAHFGAFNSPSDAARQKKGKDLHDRLLRAQAHLNKMKDDPSIPADQIAQADLSTY